MSAPSDAGVAGGVPARRKVILDTDAGCDDAIAILLALRDPTIEVVAITTVFGNVPLAQATENVFTILRVFDRLDIPFFAGASQPLVMDFEVSTWPGHGVNGLGDASFLEGGEHHDHEAYLKRVQLAVGAGHAVQAMIDLSSKYPGEIDLIALGPLTNLALGCRMDPVFASRFRSLTIMGGSSHARGNASMASEFNFACDAEGAYVTLRHFPSATLPVVIVPWEATEQYALTWAEFDQLCEGHEEHVQGDDNTRHKLEASFLKKTHAKYELVAREGFKEKLEAELKAAAAGGQPSTSGGSLLTTDQAAALNELPSLPELVAAAAATASVPNPSQLQPTHDADAPTEYVCCDSYAVAAFLQPSLISKHARHYVEVILQGTAVTRGMLAIDWYDRKKVDASKRVTVVTGIDRAAYLRLMQGIFQPASKQA